MRRRVRPLGPAFVTGAVRGGIAGLLVGLPLGLLGLLLAPRIGIYVSPAERWLALAFAVLGVPAAAASLGIGDALSVRLGNEGSRAFARLLGGLAAPFLATLSVLSLVAARSGRMLWQEALGIGKKEILQDSLGLLVLGLALGTGLVIAGSPAPGATSSERRRRAVVAAAGVTAALSIPLGLALGPHVFAIVLFLSYACAIGLWAGHLAARPIGRRVLRWIEPGRNGLEIAGRAERRTRALERFELARPKPGLSPSETRAALEAALGFARAAFDESITTGMLASFRGSDARRIVALLFTLGKLDEIELLLREMPDGEVARAELLRVRGDPAQAVKVARAALDAMDESAPRASSIRGNAHAVLALAEASLGRYELARDSLAQVSGQRKWEPLLDRFEAAALESEIARMEREQPPKVELRLEETAPLDDLSPVSMPEETPILGSPKAPEPDAPSYDRLPSLDAELQSGT